MASLMKRTCKNGPVWYLQYYVGTNQRRIRASDNHQIAKEKLRRFDAARAAGDDLTDAAAASIRQANRFTTGDGASHEPR